MNIKKISQNTSQIPSEIESLSQKINGYKIDKINSESKQQQIYAITISKANLDGSDMNNILACNGYDAYITCYKNQMMVYMFSKV